MVPRESERILVESQYLLRCKWCGTPSSPRWVITENGLIFCSEECQIATTAISSKYASLGFLVIGFSVLLASIPLMMFSPLIPLYGIVLTLIGFCAYDRGKEGEKYLSRKDKYRNVQLLVCDYCSHVNPPSVLKCQNCGATIESADFAGDSWPEWFTRLPIRYKGIKCPKCSAIYTYHTSKADDEGKVICQNCAEVFRLSTNVVD